MEVLEAIIRTRGEVTFTSREVGRLADTDAYILNTALYYALGLAKGRYVDREFEPTYIKDTESIANDLYVSPAAPVPDTRPKHVTTTYNATRDEYAVINYSAEDDPYEKQNLPSYGTRRSLTQGTNLRFFIIPRARDVETVATNLPQYIRLGKKRGKAHLELNIVDAARKSGTFKLNHPIGAYDYDETPKANVITKSMQPTLIILQADYEGEYLQIDCEGTSDDRDVVEIPANIGFLSRKR